MGTEGQGIDGFGEKYKLTQFAIPMGAGVKIAVTERLNIGLEAGVRKTFTDYIDDHQYQLRELYSTFTWTMERLAAALGQSEQENI